MIARYRLEYDDLDVYENGNLVNYEDHQREVAQLLARVAELEAALGECLSALEDSGEYPVTTDAGFDVLWRGKLK